MKYLLVLIVLMVAIFVWRSNREVDKPAKRREDRPADDAVDMVGCDLCGLHCPRTDLVAGRRGVYCTVQHRDQAEA